MNLSKEILAFDWDKFHFLRYEYLYYSIPILAIVLIGIFIYSEKIPWKNEIAKHLHPYVIIKGTEWKSRRMHITVFILFLIGLVSFLGPTWKQEKAPVKKVKSKLLLALDLSQSMMVNDVSPNRLERAKFKIHDLLNSNPKAETALLVYAASTHIAVPFTTDYKIILDHLDGLKPSMMPVKGTSYKALFERIDTLFTNNIAPGRILIFTDDLEDLGAEYLSNIVQNNNIKITIFPFASKSGANIPTLYGNSSIISKNGNNVHSKLNEQKFKSFNSLENVDLNEITLDNSDIIAIADEIGNNLVFEDKTDNEQENWIDFGYWLLIPLCLIFLFTFRKGWALNSLLILLSLSSCSKFEVSDQNRKKERFAFADLWYTKDYQAQKKYNTKNYKEAALKFKDPIHKGVSYYKAGDYLSAEAAFIKDTTSLIAKYNLGLTYAKLGKLEESKKIFEEVIDSDENFSDVKNNLEQIENLIAASDSLKPEEVSIEENKPRAKNKQNTSPEDLGGGGQKATEKDMQKERLEEEQDTGIRKGKELDEIPENMTFGKEKRPQNILMRKVDDDPALFLTRKFSYQINHKQVKADQTHKTW